MTMKKLWCLVLSLMMLMSIGAAGAEIELADYYCKEGNFSTKIPLSGNSGYVEGTGLQIFTEVPGYPPYVIVSRRPMEMKFSNPQNFLNNVFREYMEDKYKDQMLGMNPAKDWEVGGKTLLGARYMYRINDYTLVLLRLIEVRDEGDVEYSAVYEDGKEDSVKDALDAAVRYYTPDRKEPSGSADVAQTDTSATHLRPAAVPADTDPANGTFWVRVPDGENIFNGGYFTAQLYSEDLYPADAVRALSAGDQVVIHGDTLTVQSLKMHEDDGGVIELYPEEEFDGYIVFEPANESGYSVRINDWVAVSPVTDVRVMMPLPNDFSFAWVGGEDASVYDADSFVSLVTGEDPPVLSEYNTTITFRDGLVMNISHSDYPDGP